MSLVCEDFYGREIRENDYVQCIRGFQRGLEGYVIEISDHEYGIRMSIATAGGRILTTDALGIDYQKLDSH